MTTASAALEIVAIDAFATSFPVTEAHSVRLGVGRTLKRDAVMVKVTTADGLVGWGESHHGRAHTTIAHFINTALRDIVLGCDAGDSTGVWERIYARQIASHGLGTACAIAMSGLDMALWDIRGKAAGLPLYRLLGGGDRAVPAYAGGVALGWQNPDALVEEARVHVEAGYRALKLRLGESPAADIARVEAVRKAFGPDIEILTDANCAYTLDDARRVIPALDALDVGWLEEPFPAHDHRSYAQARALGAVPFAAGENHYTRFDFERLLAEGVVTRLQPDLSKTGGITETLRIAAMASAHRVPIHLHTSMTGVNMAATIHVLASIGNAGYFEADVSHGNLFRDALIATPFELDPADGSVRPLSAPGLGVEVDEDFLHAHPPIEGPAYR